MGLSFSVPKGVTVPPSLVNVYKEIEKDMKNIDGKFTIPKHGDLTEWAKQGVLMLNNILTVREGKSGSQSTYGWKTFTEAAIKKISQELRGVVFLLWGNDAQSILPHIDKAKHYVLCAGHPSPLNTKIPFSGCLHFSKCNELLTKHDNVLSKSGFLLLPKKHTFSKQGLCANTGNAVVIFIIMID